MNWFIKEFELKELSWELSTAALQSCVCWCMALIRRWLPCDRNSKWLEKTLWLEQLEVDWLPPFNRVALVKLSKLSRFCFAFFLNRRALCLKILPTVVVAKNCDFFSPTKRWGGGQISNKEGCFHSWDFHSCSKLKPYFISYKVFSCSFAFSSSPHPFSHLLKGLAAGWGIGSAFFTVAEGKVGNSDVGILVTFSFPFL